jgi:hypothetical protein
MDKDSTQLDLILIYENEGDGLAAFNLLKFQNHVKLTMTPIPNSKLSNFEFAADDGREILLPRISCDKKSFEGVKSRLNFVKSATLSFCKPEVLGNKNILKIIEFYVSGLSLQKAISEIQSFETSLNQS